MKEEMERQKRIHEEQICRQRAENEAALTRQLAEHKRLIQAGQKDEAQSMLTQINQIQGQLQKSPTKNWSGHFTDDRADSSTTGSNRWPMDFIVTFNNSRTSFEAFGTDEIGTFELRNIHINGNQVSFLKMYYSHTVSYEATLSEASMSGRWWITTCPQDKGNFNMAEM